MIEKDVKVKIYAESKEHGFNIHKEMSFDEYCKNGGYIISKWHNVEDGDLPQGNLLNLRIVLRWLDVYYYAEGAYINNEFIIVDNANKFASVIAWTELPLYEE